MGPYRLRLARPEDAPTIRAAAAAAFGVYVEAIGRAPAPMIADFERHIGDSAVVLAENSDGAALGYAILYPDPAAPDALHLDSVAVIPAAQGGGVGRALIADAEARAAAAGLSRITLYTNAAMSGALALYPRLGYRETRRAREQGFDRIFFEKRL